MRINIDKYKMQRKINSMKNSEIVTWEQLEKEYKLKFKLKNGEFRPVNEWLDDLYICMNYKEMCQLIMTIMNNGEALFQDLLVHKE